MNLQASDYLTFVSPLCIHRPNNASVAARGFSCLPTFVFQSSRGVIGKSADTMAPARQPLTLLECWFSPPPLQPSPIILNQWLRVNRLSTTTWARYWF